MLQAGRTLDGVVEMRPLLLATGLMVIAGACSGQAPRPPANLQATTIPTSSSTGPSGSASSSSSDATSYAVGSELAPGTYVSVVFETPVTFTVPDGWKVFEDEPGQFGLARIANDAPCLCVWRDVRAAATSCAEAPEPGIGANAKAISTWLAAHRGIKASPVNTVEIGGLKGYVLDIQIDPTWTKTCSGRGPDPTVPTLVGSGISTGVAWEVGSDSRQRLYLLDLPAARGTIAINEEVCCGADFDAQTSADDAVVTTFTFK
jgi:hypothetical protein